MRRPYALPRLLFRSLLIYLATTAIATALVVFQYVPGQYALAPFAGYDGTAEVESGIAGLSTFYGAGPDLLAGRLGEPMPPEPALVRTWTLTEPVTADVFRFRIRDLVPNKGFDYTHGIAVRLYAADGSLLAEVPSISDGGRGAVAGLVPYDVPTPAELGDPVLAAALDECRGAGLPEAFCVVYARAVAGEFEPDLTADLLACFDDPTRTDLGGGFGFGGGGEVACTDVLAADGARASVSVDDPDAPDQTDQCFNTACVQSGAVIRPGMTLGRIELESEPFLIAPGANVIVTLQAERLSEPGRMLFERVITGAATASRSVPAVPGIVLLFAGGVFVVLGWRLVRWRSR